MGGLSFKNLPTLQGVGDIFLNTLEGMWGVCMCVCACVCVCVYVDVTPGLNTGTIPKLTGEYHREMN